MIVMTVIEFLITIGIVASVVVSSLVLLVLRDIRDQLATLVAQNRLEAKRRSWVVERHDELV